MNALDTCNACEVNAADSESAAGYCAECEADAKEQPDLREHPSFDHDGTFRHHHDIDTGEPVWWGNCEQFGGEKRPHPR